MNMPQLPWNTERFNEKDGSYKFLLSGRKILTIRFGLSAVEFGLNDDFSTVISLQMSFSFVQHEQSQRFDPDFVCSLAPLLARVGCEIENVTADQSGFLHLHFNDGSQIRGPSEEEGFRYEAWQISDRHKFLAVCAVGGTVHIWDPHVL